MTNDFVVGLKLNICLKSRRNLKQTIKLPFCLKSDHGVDEVVLLLTSGSCQSSLRLNMFNQMQLRSSIFLL